MRISEVYFEHGNYTEKSEKCAQGLDWRINWKIFKDFAPWRWILAGVL
jgi:hypothetical protein